MARGFAGLSDVDLTVVVNVGDDADNHGLRISPDLDTVIYTLAGVEGPYGWGRAGDTFRMNEELERFGVENTFRIGDLDLAFKLYRTLKMSDGRQLSEVIDDAVDAFGVTARVIPATNDRLRTEVRIDPDGWISFQEYFVKRRAEDEVLDLRYIDSQSSSPSPGLIDAIKNADLVTIAPSNPPLSIWPILAVPGIRDAVAGHPNVIAVSPLIGGKPIKGPADRVLSSLGLPPGNLGVAAAYEGLIHSLVVDNQDSNDVEAMSELNVVVTNTHIADLDNAVALARELADL